MSRSRTLLHRLPKTLHPLTVTSGRRSFITTRSVFTTTSTSTTTSTTKTTTSRRTLSTTPLRTSTMSSSSEEPPEPTGTIATSGIELLTFGTPNGHKASILLEELKAAYGTDYTWQSVSIMKDTQKEPWFLRFSPNGRIPCIVDHDRGGFGVFEGAAILAYLVRKCDKEHRFSFPPDSLDASRVEQWVAWQHGGLGPMQGQANHFYRLAKERIPYPTQRYVGETERLLGVLERRLSGADGGDTGSDASGSARATARDYLVGPGKGKYSIADIAVFSWANWAHFAGVHSFADFPATDAWLKRVDARPAVQAGTNIPKSPGNANANYEKRIGEDDEFAGKERELRDKADEAKRQYGYKYKSP